MNDARQIALFASRRERDRILDAMSQNHRVYLETLRSFAREVALRHPQGHVTIDDVRRLMEQRDFPFPREVRADERILGTVFRSREFQPVGQRSTERSGIGRSAITIYTLKTTQDASPAHQAAMRPKEAV